MFHFDRALDKLDRIREKAAQREHTASASREAKLAAEREAVTEMADAMAEVQNIAVYFNQRARDVSGYQMSVREKDASGAGSKSVMEPPLIDTGIVNALRQNSNYFLEGHARNGAEFVKDIYDGSYPHDIRREQNGRRDILDTRELESYFQSKMKTGGSKVPRYTVIARDDLSDVPLAGAREEREQNHSGISM